MAIWWSSAMEDANNWDLHAVVRGCSATASIAALDPFHSYPTDCFFINEGLLEDDTSLFPDDTATKDAVHELEELCRPFVSKPQELSQERGVETVQHRPQQQVEEPQQRVSQSPRSKRRKNQQKKVVCQVPADGVSSDMWAWRKYGQKPIKGSPYPRGYYRCSSSKGCLARKQVERSRTDPTMLIITYTAEHNHPVPTHRNSLAGSTRSKFPALASREDEQNLACNNKTSHSRVSAMSMTGFSPTTPLTVSMEDELLMPKADADEENYDDDEDSMVPVGGMTDKEDMVFMDSRKLGDDIDDEDFVTGFFSNIWPVEGGAMAGPGSSR